MLHPALPQPSPRTSSTVSGEGSQGQARGKAFSIRLRKPEKACSWEREEAPVHGTDRTAQPFGLHHTQPEPSIYGKPLPQQPPLWLSDCGLSSHNLCLTSFRLCCLSNHLYGPLHHERPSPHVLCEHQFLPWALSQQAPLL